MGAASAAQEAGDREAEDQAWWRCIELDDGSDAALKGDPGLPPFRLRPYLSYANSLRERGDATSALTILDRALVRWPNDADAHMLVGMCHRSQKDWGRAAVAFQRSVELAPRASVCILLADSLDKCGRRDESVAWLHHSLVVDPDYEESHYNLGCLQERDGDIDAAIDRFRRAIELDPDYADAHARIGPLLMRRALKAPRAQADDWPLAFDHLCRATELRPEDGWSHAHLASMCQTAKRFEEAEGYYRTAIRLLPDVGLLWAHLGSLLSLQGADQEAERALRHAVSLDPDDGWVRFWLGKYLYALDDDEGRLELLRAHDLGCPQALAWLSAREPEDGEGGEDGGGLNA
jgi:tetratricopeptide (TPR) repeat protein